MSLAKIVLGLVLIVVGTANAQYKGTSDEGWPGIPVPTWVPLLTREYAARLIRNHQICVGFHESEVVMALGKPETCEQATTNHALERWYYAYETSDLRYNGVIVLRVWFEDGFVRRWDVAEAGNPKH
jgi:hypothetical protein